MRTKNKKFNILNWWPGLFALFLPIVIFEVGFLYQAKFSLITFLTFIVGAFLLIKAYSSFKSKKYLYAILWLLGALVLPMILLIVLVTIFSTFGWSI